MTQEQLDKAIQNRREREKAYIRCQFAKKAYLDAIEGKDQLSVVDEFESVFQVERKDIINFMKVLWENARSRYEQLDKEFKNM